MMMDKIGKNNKKDDLGIVIFVAILIHKIPASIGLGSFLGRSFKTDKGKIRNHLLAFTLTSPLACILTFSVLYKLVKNRIDNI